MRVKTVLSKNTTQIPRPRLELGPFDPELVSSALAIRPPRLPYRRVIVLLVKTFSLSLLLPFRLGLRNIFLISETTELICFVILTTVILITLFRC